MLQRLADNWLCFDGGRRWRCRSPAYLCEVDAAGAVPSLLPQVGVAESVRRIRSFYAGRLNFGPLDKDGTALDILVANAMTESYGSVPSPLSTDNLNRILDRHPELPLDSRLDLMLREIGADKATRWLVRFEPGYSAPGATPGRVSVGAHQMLISTAQGLPSQRQTDIRQQVVLLAAQSLHSAQLAIEYLNSHQGQHVGELPLIAATYNAGRPRSTTANPWHLVQYGEHITRWLSYYNASRQAITGNASAPFSADTAAPPPQPITQKTMLPAGSPLAAAAAAGGAGLPADYLSPHFTLAELTASDTARKLGISNIPGPEIRANLKRLAERLELVRELLGGLPMKINSAYRCEALNRAVHGANNSMHLYGLAADIVCPDYGPPLKIARAIAASQIGFDQVIHEYDSWVHLGLAPAGQAERRQQLTINKLGTQVGLIG